MLKGLRSIKISLPQILALTGAIFLVSPLIFDFLYQNSLAGTGAILLFSAWIAASYQNRQTLVASGRWEQQKKAMIALSLCVALGAVMLIYYEIQMPKYRVAITNKELYKVPPQLNKRQLFELGSECNTYGNTLCSHAVFAKIVKLDPRNYIALGNLAMAQSHLGFHQYAVENFMTAITNGARTYDIFKFYGHSLKALGKKQEALEAYRKSLQLKPNQSYLNQIVLDLETQ